MKVLVVSQYFWPESFRINEIVGSLHERNVEVTVLTAQPNYPSGNIYEGYKAIHAGVQQHSLGFTIYRVPIVPRGKKSKFGLIANYISFVVAAILCGAWFLRKKQFDAIFVYGTSPIFQALPAIVLSWVKRTPVVLWVQDLWPESLSATGYVNNKRVLNIVESVVKFIYRHVDLLLVQSKAFILPVQSMAGDAKAIFYYPNSVDNSFANPSDIKVPKEMGLDGYFSVVFAGNIGAAQSVETIVQAAILLKDYPEIRFVMVGDGSRQAWMREQIVAQDISNLHMAGRYDVKYMPPLMQNASVLLVSLTDQAIFAATVPNKVQAYLAAGRPIIASLNGEGAKLILEAKAGLTAPAEDAQALAQAVLELYKMSPEQRDVLGKNGRQYYQDHFDHEYLIGELIAHLNSVSHQTKGITQ